MATKTLSKQSFKNFTENLIKATNVVGVKRKENKFAYGHIKQADELILDYDVTLRSPREFFQPPKEELFKFSLEGKASVETVNNVEDTVLLGVHTYDLKAINQMDKIWMDDNCDNHYLSKRKATKIIAIEPTKATKWSFWSSVGSATVNSGYDLLLTDIGNSYVIEVGTENGANLLSKFATDAKDSTSDDLAARENSRAKLNSLCSSDRNLDMSADEITKLIKDNYENGIWEKQAEKCYSCGSCNLVCPTCYCFDVKDEINLDLKTGKRERVWDGCLLNAFAKVGTGENFREHRSSRFRHRIFRKMAYVADKIGDLACVGCGRCSSVCLPDITDPVKIIKELKN